MVTRGVLSPPPLALDLFTNMYLAGTIIFGGGPVVIPLLREYVVAPGWVSSRDFLLGLAVIQAFPGPGFNCARPPSSPSGGTTLTPDSRRLPRRTSPTLPTWRSPRLPRHLPPRFRPLPRLPGPLARPPHKPLGHLCPPRRKLDRRRPRLHRRIPSLGDWLAQARKECEQPRWGAVVGRRRRHDVFGGEVVECAAGVGDCCGSWGGGGVVGGCQVK